MMKRIDQFTAAVSRFFGKRWRLKPAQGSYGIYFVQYGYFGIWFYYDHEEHTYFAAKEAMRRAMATKKIKR